MTPAAAQNLINLRQQALRLAECPGWTDWALPALRKMITDKQQAILTDRALRGEDLDDARAEEAALSGFLTALRTEATAAFKAILPGTLPDTIAEHVMPDETVRRQIIAALSLDPRAPIAEPPRKAEPAPIQPPHNPFAGVPQPAAAKPSATSTP